MKRLTVFLMLGAMLAACGGAPASPTAAPSPVPATSTPAPTAPNATATAPPAKGPALPADALIVYTRSGGIAGRTDQWTIYADGRVVTGKGETSMIDPARVADALGQLEKLKFFDMAGSVSRQPPCPDCFTYTLTVTLGGKTKSISTTDAATNVPPEVDQAFQTATKLIAGMGK